MLETQVQDYEARDLHTHEKEHTVRKLVEANKQLRDDLVRETERYSILEGRYKDLLVKHNVTEKESIRNKELLFSAQTGGNIGNYERFLDEEHNDRRTATIAAGGKKRFGYEDDLPVKQSNKKGPGASFDRTFEDLY